MNDLWLQLARSSIFMSQPPLPPRSSQPPSLPAKTEVNPPPIPNRTSDAPELPQRVSVVTQDEPPSLPERNTAPTLPNRDNKQPQEAPQLPFRTNGPGLPPRTSDPPKLPNRTEPSTDWDLPSTADTSNGSFSGGSNPFQRLVSDPQNTNQPPLPQKMPSDAPSLPQRTQPPLPSRQESQPPILPSREEKVELEKAQPEVQPKLPPRKSVLLTSNPFLAKETGNNESTQPKPSLPIREPELQPVDTKPAPKKLNSPFLKTMTTTPSVSEEHPPLPSREPNKPPIPPREESTGPPSLPTRQEPADSAPQTVIEKVAPKQAPSLPDRNEVESTEPKSAPKKLSSPFLNGGITLPTLPKTGPKKSVTLPQPELPQRNDTNPPSPDSQEIVTPSLPKREEPKQPPLPSRNTETEKGEVKIVQPKLPARMSVALPTPSNEPKSAPKKLSSPFLNGGIHPEPTEHKPTLPPREDVFESGPPSLPHREETKPTLPPKEDITPTLPPREVVESGPPSIPNRVEPKVTETKPAPKKLNSPFLNTMTPTPHVSEEHPPLPSREPNKPPVPAREESTAPPSLPTRRESMVEPAPQPVETVIPKQAPKKLSSPFLNGTPRPKQAPKKQVIPKPSIEVEPEPNTNQPKMPAIPTVSEPTPIKNDAKEHYRTTGSVLVPRQAPKKYGTLRPSQPKESLAPPSLPPRRNSISGDAPTPEDLGYVANKPGPPPIPSKKPELTVPVLPARRNSVGSGDAPNVNTGDVEKTAPEKTTKDLDYKPLSDELRTHYIKGDSFGDAVKAACHGNEQEVFTDLYQCTIKGVKKQNEVMGSDRRYVMMYIIEVVKSGRKWTIFRRYNQFFDLDAKLKKKKLLSKSTDLLPPKDAKTKKSDYELLEMRKKKLQEYLIYLTESVYIGGSGVFFTFIEPVQLGDEKPSN